ncbi:unnamed protein product [Urochloa humidicola]
MASTALSLAAAAAILGSQRCLASDTITVDSDVSGRRTIVSRGGNFELGFFRPAGDSNHHYYVGIQESRVAVHARVGREQGRAALGPGVLSARHSRRSNLVLTDEAGKLI